MSIDLNWEELTTGPDGDALAQRIRTFIHEKFQKAPLPRFVRSVNVQGFDFGTVPPEVELEDITDPLPDFYDQDPDAEEEEDKEEEDESDADARGQGPWRPPSLDAAAARKVDEEDREEDGETAAMAMMRDQRMKRKRPGRLRTTFGVDDASNEINSPFLGTSTPGILGGPGLSYFQGHLNNNTQTPLAAVAGAHLGGGRTAQLPASCTSSGQGPAGHDRSRSVDWSPPPDVGPAPPPLRDKSSVSTLAPTSDGTSRPPTREAHPHGSPTTGKAPGGGEEGESRLHARPQVEKTPSPAAPGREPRVDDVQAVFRIQYSGDIRLKLTAEILLDYPMPSFVGIPLKLNITGLTFDGVAVLAKIRKRLHFCFLGPEDALAAVGPEEVVTGADHRRRGGTAQNPQSGRPGGLLQEIRVESEIGEREGGKQSLKNVGKVERFVLEQVRRIFEEEFVYPSFWTFLI